MMTKCDTCYDLRAQGGNPVCVDSCPMRAIEFGLISELRAKHGTNADAEGLPSSSRTHPNLVVRYKGRERSEEHTSELQSLMRISYAVFCLKKKISKQDHRRLITKD